MEKKIERTEKPEKYFFFFELQKVDYLCKY